METVTMREAKTHLSRLVAKAPRGEPFLIVKAGEIGALAPKYGTVVEKNVGDGGY